MKNFFRGDNLKFRSLRGTLWVGISFGSENVLRLAGNLVLTRLLFPEAFGLMAIVQVFIAGLAMFSDLGIRASVVQDSKGADPAFLNTAFVLQIARGVLLWLITCAIAAPVAAFYDEPLLAQIMPVAGLVAVLQGLNSTKLYTADRSMRLGRITALKILSQTVGILVMIALAWSWQSVWALVVGGLVGPVLTMLTSHLLVPGVANRFAFDSALAWRLFHFGKYIFIATVAGFFVRHADRAILGRFVELDQLAFYNIAFFLASAPMMLSGQLANRVLFPLYSTAARNEEGATVAKIGRLRRLLIGGSLLLLTIFAVVGVDLIALLYDDRYISSGPLLVLLAVSLMPSTINAAYSVLPVAHGDSRRFAFLAITSAVLRTVGILYGASTFGLIGVVIMPMLTTILYYPIQVLFTLRYRAWDPKLDLFAFVLACLAASLALYLNPEAMALLPF